MFVILCHSQNQKDSIPNNIEIVVLKTVQQNVPKEEKQGWSGSIDDWLKLCGYFLVLGGSILTYYKWRKDQNWKRKETLMTRITSFSLTPGTWNAILMLESPDRNVPLWDKENREQKYVRVKRSEVAVALLPPNFLPYRYSPKETAIRDSFNDFLDRLSHLEFYRESNLLNKKEIEVAICNWIVTIQNLSKSNDLDDQGLLRSLFLYIHYKKMTKVIAIFSQFGIEYQTKIKEFEIFVKKEIKQNVWQRLPEENFQK